MPQDILGRTLATLKQSACVPYSKGFANPLNLLRDGDCGLLLLPINEKFPVVASHKLASIKSLQFVHTSRHNYQRSDLATTMVGTHHRIDS